MQYIYTMNGVSKTVPPKRQIIKDISLSFFPGAKIGLLGLNGAGKSTVLKIMAGVDHDFVGEARPQAGIKVGYLAQEPQLDPTHTVREAVEQGVGEVLQAQAALDKVYEAYAEEGADFDKLAAEQQRLEAILASGDAHTLEHQLEVAADALRLPPWEAVIGKLSGGEKRRVALCQLLLQKPDMLLLDEPTNHLDAESVEWLEQFLARYTGTVVAVTHDRYFLDNAAEWILELDRGRGIPWKGNYTDWLTQKDARLKQEESTEKARQKALAGIKAAGEAGDWRASEAVLRMSFRADYRRDASVNVNAIATAQQAVVCYEATRERSIALREKLPLAERGAKQLEASPPASVSSAPTTALP